MTGYARELCTRRNNAVLVYRMWDDHEKDAIDVTGIAVAPHDRLIGLHRYLT